MQINKYKLLLRVLQGLVYAKRGLFGLFRVLKHFFVYVDQGYTRTLGFALFKIIFYTKKNLQRLSFARKESRLEFFGRRGTLQIALFIMVLFIMAPHSKLYTKEYKDIPGRKTLLYEIVGPGDQNFEYYEEISIDEFVGDSKVSGSWKDGVIIANSSGTQANSLKIDELSGTAMGGQALTKPIIMPGVNLKDINGSADSLGVARTEIVYYEVKPGDIIGTIAQQFHLNVNTILWANDLTERSYIRPDDKLAILPADGVIHTVKSGDTVSKIAHVYEAEIDDIITVNRLQKDGADIVVGETLFVPGGIKPQPVYKTPVYIATPKPSGIKNLAAPPPSVSAPAGSGYIWPTAASTITQYYGWRHLALDIAGPVGTPVYAAKSGTVLVSQCGWNYGFGCYVHIDHGNGITTLYAHASQLYVSAQEYVTQGQTIMAIGSTGNSSGPHVHFEVRINGNRQNPLAYVRR
ncbi:MAG: peptidoglycan DD-metalloendopeptidase family protein [Candidatus Magasanikbacteria bacterium]|nr:peptidoglycan DD-metalloendopeptidase family protein [Candidatus Magasanikbacteria bacterium]